MSEIATWPGAGLGFQIDYSREVLENIRGNAMRGLMDLPEVRVGGILLGERQTGHIVILDSFELSCSHALGPSFLLTPEELAQARDKIAKADASRVIGWYCSRGLGLLQLTDSDRVVLAALFSAPLPTWHIGLLVQPYLVRPARIAFLSLDSRGELLQGEPGELAEWHEERAAEAVPVVGPELAPIPVTPVVGPVSPLGHDPVVTIRTRNGSRWIRYQDPFAVLAVDAAQREGSRRKRLTWILAAGTVIFSGVTELILSRFWTPPPPPPPLVLQSSEVDGTLVFRWNNDAVKGVDHAEIFITDGDGGRAVPLNRSQLSAGEWSYVRKSPRVTAAMTAGRQQAETSFAAPVPRRKKSPVNPAAPKGASRAP